VCWWIEEGNSGGGFCVAGEYDASGDECCGVNISYVFMLMARKSRDTNDQKITWANVTVTVVTA